MVYAMVQVSLSPHNGRRRLKHEMVLVFEMPSEQVLCLIDQICEKRIIPLQEPNVFTAPGDGKFMASTIIVKIPTRAEKEGKFPLPDICNSSGAQTRE